MLTYTTRRNLAGKLVNDSSADNLTILDDLLNEGDRGIINLSAWSFREKSTTVSTVAGEQFVNLPASLSRLINATITIGATTYTPREVKSRSRWDRLNQSSYQSDIPEWIYPFNNRLGIYPTPASVNTVTINFLRGHRDLSIPDYTTGTVSAVTNGGTTVTGSGTSWNASMAGRVLNIAVDDEVNAGDGEWYEIASVESTTSLTLTRAYEGTSIAAGSADYTIGQVSIIPEDFHMLSVYRACELYYTSVNPNEERAQRYKGLYAEGISSMKTELGAKSTSVSV